MSLKSLALMAFHADDGYDQDAEIAHVHNEWVKSIKKGAAPGEMNASILAKVLSTLPKNGKVYKGYTSRHLIAGIMVDEDGCISLLDADELKACQTYYHQNEFILFPKEPIKKQAKIKKIGKRPYTRS
jgi:hypothetical protein